MPKHTVTHPWGSYKEYTRTHKPETLTTEQQDARQKLNAELREHFKHSPNFGCAFWRRGDKSKIYRYITTDHGSDKFHFGEEERDRIGGRATWSVLLHDPRTGQRFWVSYPAVAKGWRFANKGHETKRQRERREKLWAKIEVERERQRTLPICDLRKELEGYKPLFLEYYPYGPKDRYEGWLCGKVKLNERYLQDPEERASSTGDTKDKIRFRIMEEVNRALYYLTIHQPDGYGWQRKEALWMSRVFVSGHGEWVKIKDLPRNWRSKEAQELRVDMHNGGNNIGMEEGGASVYNIERKIKEYIGMFESRDTHWVKKVRPIDEMGYPELCAIELIVDMTFGNLC